MYNLQTAFEAVDFQQDTLFFGLLTKYVNKMRKSKDLSPSGAEVKALVDLMRRKTKIKFFLTFVEDRQLNGMVMVPSLSKNHPILNGLQGGVSGFQADKLFNDVNPVDGWVDRNKAEVGGVFTQIDVEMFLTTGLIQSGNVTDEEIAALILHEIGHIFSYYEALATMAKENVVLAAVARRYVDEPDEKLKIKLIDATRRNFNMDVEHADLVNYSNADAVHAVLLTRHGEHLRSVLGHNFYDYRNFESAADQFAARMGAARPLATLLAKISSRSSSRYGTAMYLFIEVMKTIAILAAGLLNPMFFVMFLVGYDPTYKVYDPPEQRIRRVRHSLVEGMKEKNLSRDRKKVMLKDIEIVDRALAEYTDRREFYEILYTSLLPNMRNQAKRLKAQQQLEQLANNDLFVKSMQLSII